jgi:transcriptional regulator GlxA family with amidase domain
MAARSTWFSSLPLSLLLLSGLACQGGEREAGPAPGRTASSPLPSEAEARTRRVLVPLLPGVTGLEQVVSFENALRAGGGEIEGSAERRIEFVFAVLDEAGSPGPSGLAVEPRRIAQLADVAFADLVVLLDGSPEARLSTGNAETIVALARDAESVIAFGAGVLRAAELGFVGHRRVAIPEQHAERLRVLAPEAEAVVAGGPFTDGLLATAAGDDAVPVLLLDALFRWSGPIRARAVLDRLERDGSISSGGSVAERLAAIEDAFQDPYDPPRVLAALRAAVEEGVDLGPSVVAAPAMQVLRDEPSYREPLRGVVQMRPRGAVVAVTGAGEPGRPLRVHARFVDADDRPIPDCPVRLYQTAHDGRYAPEASEEDDARNPRLFAALCADREGSFVVSTVLPGEYGESPPHFHMGFVLPGERPRGTRLYFLDGGPVHPEIESDIREGHAYGARLVEDARGMLHAHVTFRP